MDRLTAMTVFAKVAEEGGFTAAARRLALSKSSVSKQVADLEAWLGARLVNRTTRRLSLTEAGRCFYAHCTRIARQVEEAELEAGRAHAEPQGLLRVNLPMSLGQRWIAPLLAEFAALHPKIRLELELDDRAVDGIAGGFDVTIRAAVALADSSLVARRLAPCRVVVCGAPAYLAQRGVPSEPAELERHDCLVYTVSSAPDTWRFGGPRGELRVPVSASLRANNGDVLREAALGGLGLARLPSFIVGPDLARGALRAVLVPFEDPSSAIWAIHTAGRRPATKVRAFVDFLAARLGPTPVWDGAARAAPPPC